MESENASSRRESNPEHWLHKPVVLSSIPSNCQPFHFHLIPFIPMWGKSSKHYVYNGVGYSQWCCGSTTTQSRLS